MSQEEVTQINSQKEVLEQEILKIKEFYAVEKDKLMANLQKELNGLNTNYSSVMEKANQNITLKQQKLKEAETHYFAVKAELKEAKETHKKISTAMKEAKTGHEKKKKKLLKDLDTDQNFKLKTKESEIKYLEKKLKSIS
ncbi:hypothetical protein NEF87_003143 [Candidatus Lokiarchaeum ossiferum]|uniref:Chromosome partition protein Smc n=1 Tax=Candidatus Lokiarchaeum ossiferum TaxID=2951803 RepID=A0ABY6HTL7_9ARCH|nr:hypothetical protein NEF87_003143 [Candidatus Lokiarchaeum sp. B-35]